MIDPDLLRLLRLALFADLDKAMIRVMEAHEEIRHMAEEDRAERVRKHLAMLAEDGAGHA